jgi:hypothetical protein
MVSAAERANTLPFLYRYGTPSSSRIPAKRHNPRRRLNRRPRQQAEHDASTGSVGANSPAGRPGGPPARRRRLRHHPRLTAVKRGSPGAILLFALALAAQVLLGATALVAAPLLHGDAPLWQEQEDWDAPAPCPQHHADCAVCPLCAPSSGQSVPLLSTGPVLPAPAVNPLPYRPGQPLPRAPPAAHRIAAQPRAPPSQV